MKHLLLILFSGFIVDCSHTSKGGKSSAIKPLWTVKAGMKSPSLRVRLYHNVSPVFAGDLVIQGNGWDGIQAFEKRNGRLVWSYEIKGGVSSPVALAAGMIYFGGGGWFCLCRAGEDRPDGLEVFHRFGKYGRARSAGGRGLFYIRQSENLRPVP